MLPHPPAARRRGVRVAWTAGCSGLRHRDRLARKEWVADEATGAWPAALAARTYGPSAGTVSV
jgi:hypothetical protein